jgi:UDP-hydrolysing UDP-N-acetyl-D-glucosamine 2-epimerase
MHKRKICVVITARPSYSRVKSLLSAINDHPSLELQLVVAASALLDRYGSAVKQIEKDGFIISEKIYNVIEGENLTAAAKTTGLGILEISTAFQNLKPDIVVTIADRYETMATAVAASYMNIPLAHLQGGEVTGNIDEKVRHAITKLSDYHFVSSRESHTRVLKLGECEKSVFLTGCPSIDIAANIRSKSTLAFNPFSKYGGVGEEFCKDQDYLVVLQHPVTTEHDESRKQITETLEAVNSMKIPTFWFWPNVDAGSDGTSKGIRAFRETKNPKRIHFFKNMEPNDFLQLLIHSKCLIGNSSVGIRECAFLGIPVVNIGTRQNGRERGANVINVDYCQQEIVQAVKKWLLSDRPQSSTIYGDGESGKKIAECLSNVELKFHKTIKY